MLAPSIGFQKKHLHLFKSVTEAYIKGHGTGQLVSGDISTFDHDSHDYSPW
jgi:hypothetical protein